MKKKIDGALQARVIKAEKEKLAKEALASSAHDEAKDIAPSEHSSDEADDGRVGSTPFSIALDKKQKAKHSKSSKGKSKSSDKDRGRGVSSSKKGSIAGLDSGSIAALAAKSSISVAGPGESVSVVGSVASSKKNNSS